MKQGRESPDSTTTQARTRASSILPVSPPVNSGICIFHLSCIPPITPHTHSNYPTPSRNTPCPCRPAHRALITTPQADILPHALCETLTRRVMSRCGRRSTPSCSTPSLTQVRMDGQSGRNVQTQARIGVLCCRFAACGVWLSFSECPEHSRVPTRAS